MRHALYFLLASAFFCVPSSAQECSKNSDACAAAPAPRSPFLEASSKPASAPAPARKKPAAKKVSAPAVPAAPAASTAAATAAPAEAAAPEPLSSPLWLFFVLGGLALLYLYLANGKKGKRK
ncbi:MAG: hypothetical protein A2016_04355 [Elusimicrobia bacterium GWF2_62_30]|nr:MAG: hypothetical protein A2016_04355 [Elusimicrobia bacterium GWF2_62_30]